MKLRSWKRSVCLLIGASLFFLSTTYVVAITELQLSPTTPGQAGTNNQGHKPGFMSNNILIKLTPQARASLKVTGEDVNPTMTGLPALDAIGRDHGVEKFTSITTSGPHRDITAAIHRWFKLSLPGNGQRLTLVEPTNDDALNLAFSGAEPLGRLMARLKREPNIESVDITVSTAATDDVAVHHVDFISGGARYFLPATSVGYTGGKGKNSSPGIDPWASLFSSTTTWNGVFDLTAIAFDGSGNGSTPWAGNYDVENAYTTKPFTTHVCDPARTNCPKDVWDAAFSLSYPAIARLRVEWLNSNFSSNYAGDVAGLVSDGRHIFSVGAFPRYWTGTFFEYDFGRPVFCGGCSTNQIGGGLGHIYLCLNKDCPITPGTAETDVTVMVTYPQ